MTKKTQRERIDELERKVEELTILLDALRLAPPPFVPYTPPSLPWYPTAPWQPQYTHSYNVEL